MYLSGTPSFAWPDFVISRLPIVLQHHPPIAQLVLPNKSSTCHHSRCRHSQILDLSVGRPPRNLMLGLQLLQASETQSSGRSMQQSPRRSQNSLLWLTKLSWTRPVSRNIVPALELRHHSHRRSQNLESSSFQSSSTMERLPTSPGDFTIETKPLDYGDMAKKRMKKGLSNTSIRKAKKDIMSIRAATQVSRILALQNIS